MSLRKEMQEVELAPCDRLDELHRIMTDVGLSGMSTRELEEWSYLMAQSLHGKGDPSY